MKEEKIKSALEIAMEKLSDLPELTREEVEEQREKEFGSVGDAIAKKYLRSSISDAELPLELTRYSDAQGLIVGRALVAGLCREMRLENDGEIGERALKGLKLLASERSVTIEKIGDEFREIVDEFGRMKREKSEQYEIMAMEKLKMLGIVGSAVRPNLNEDVHWKERLHEIGNVFEPRLAGIRNRLMQEMQSAVGSRQSPV